MKGSEKQLKWANDLIQKIKTEWEFAKNDEKSKSMPGYAAGVALWEARIDRLENADYAGDIIDLFKDIWFTDDQWHNISFVDSAYTITVRNSAFKSCAKTRLGPRLSVSARNQRRSSANEIPYC